MTQKQQKNENSKASAETRLRELGLTLPKVPEPIGNFDLGSIDHSTLYLSGQGPVLENGELARGKVGSDVTTEEAVYHAQRCALVLIAVMQQTLGSLEHVTKVQRIFGMVNSIAEFTEHPVVLNGCSDLLCEVFGARGRHARSAVGMGSLPGNITVEIEAVISISPNWKQA